MYLQLNYNFLQFCFIIPVPPSIKGGNLTTEVTALLDTMLTLECEARGVPLPTITWYRNGEAILSNRQAQYMERGHYLKIPRAQASDAGQYTCKVTSVAGSAEKTYELDIYCKNPISDDLHTFLFPCAVSLKPKLLITGLNNVFLKNLEHILTLIQAVKL